MKLKIIHEEIIVEVPPEIMWKALVRYGDVSDFHAGVLKSYKVDGSNNEASLGCERVCEIVEHGLNITLKERIVEYVEGVSYKYEVYQWKNFPIQKMFFEFKIIKSAPSYTVLAMSIEYKGKPAFLTPLLAGKIKKLCRDVLLGYKHYAETGEKRVPIKSLKTKYKKRVFAEVEYG